MLLMYRVSKPISLCSLCDHMWPLLPNRGCCYIENLATASIRYVVCVYWIWMSLKGVDNLWMKQTSGKMSFCQIGCIDKAIYWNLYNLGLPFNSIKSSLYICLGHKLMTRYIGNYYISCDRLLTEISQAITDI